MIIKKCFFIGLIILLSGFITPSFAEDKSIAIIFSRNIVPYQQAITGFKEVLSDKGYEVSLKIYDLQESASQEIVREILLLSPDLVVAVGTEAGIFTKDQIKNPPIVFSMVLDPVESGLVSALENQAENMTGVYLKIGMEEQFKKLKEMVPDLKTIGMLYDVKKMERMKQEALEVAQKLDLNLIAEAIYNPSEINRSLEYVLKNSDALWAGIDPLIYTPQSAQYIILETLRRKVPFMAFSSNYVQAGAFLALECDYTDIGRQTGELALSILEGQEARTLPIQKPRITKAIFNKNTAELIGIDVSVSSQE